MKRVGHGRRLVVGALGFALVTASCSGGDSTPTVPSTQPIATTTTTSTTTTTVPPLITNGPAIASQGDRNEIALALQFLINCNGYAQLTVDGAFGPATKAAVQLVQEALGREVTGVPDDATFAELSRGCSEDRRVTIGDADDFEKVVVGNAAGGDTETFFIRVDADRRFSVVLDSDGGRARLAVRTGGGQSVGQAGVGAWAADIAEAGDFVVEVSAADATTFAATFAIVELDPPTVASAPAGRVVVDDLDSTVLSSCLDTTGDGSYVAQTALGSLVLTRERVGDFALERGGVGAPVEFLFADGSPGYYGFDLDLDMSVGEQVVGTATVFLRESGAADEPRGVAFDFGRPVAPCEGGEGTTVVLRSSGLGIVDFGADPDEAIAIVREALLEASPSIDTGWVPIDNLSNEFGVCRQGTTEVRSVQIDNLTMYFTNGGTTFAAEGTKHFAAYVAEQGVFPFKTARNAGPGDSIGQVLAAHEDAAAGPGLTGGVDVFISSPPGSDQWLRATASGATSPTDTGAVVDSITGGRFCDN